MARERELQSDEELARTYDAEPAIIRIASEEASARGGRTVQRPGRARHSYDDRPGR